MTQNRRRLKAVILDVISGDPDIWTYDVFCEIEERMSGVGVDEVRFAIRDMINEGVIVVHDIDRLRIR